MRSITSGWEMSARTRIRPSHLGHSRTSVHERGALKLPYIGLVVARARVAAEDGADRGVLHIGEGIAELSVGMVFLVAGQDLGNPSDDLFSQRRDFLVGRWVELAKTRPLGVIHGEYAIG